MNRRLKKSVVNSLYVISFILLVLGVSLLGIVLTKKSSANDVSYVSKGILDYDNTEEVVSTKDVLIRPYIGENVSIVKSFYDYKAEAESQENSLIYYEGTYIQSSGISYSNGDSFDVVSVLDGTVTEIKDDVTLGNSITIEHNNGITSIYQSVSDILVSEGSTVTKGQVIAKSSTSNISSELNNHLYFELIINGECVNSEDYYDKSIDELGA